MGSTAGVLRQQRVLGGAMLAALMVATAGCKGETARSGGRARPENPATAVAPAIPSDSAPPPGAAPVGLAAIPPSEVRRTELWVALQGAGAVAAFDAATGQVVHRVRAGKKPAYVKVSPDGKLVAITDPPTATATIVDATTGALVRTLKTGRTPKGVNWSPDSREVWVVNEGAQPGSVFVYASPAFERVAEIAVGRAPHNVTLAEDGSRAYVTNTGSGTVTVIDARTKRALDSIPVGGAAHNLTLAPDGRTLFVTLTDRNELVAVSLPQRRVVAAIPLVIGHHVPAVDGAGGIVVGGFGGGAASVIRLAGSGRVVSNDTIPLAPGAHGVAFGPGDIAYVSVLSGFVAAISPTEHRLLRRVPVPGAPFTVSVRVLRKDGRAEGPSSREAS